MQGINGINLYFENGENIFIEEDDFSNLYIANINENAQEIPYEKVFDDNKFFANLFLLKIKNSINRRENINLLNKIYENKNLIKVALNFPNNAVVDFYVASNTDPFKKNKINGYDKSFYQDNDLCLLICPYNLKYIKNLFV